MIDMTAGAPRVRHTRPAIPRLVAISLVTFALYLATWLLERAIFYNGTAVRVLQMEPSYAAHRTLVAWQMTGYVVVTVLIFWAYLAVLKMCKAGELDGRRERLLALAVPILLNIFCLMWVPRLSQDVFSYAAHGFLGLLPGHNPLLEPVETTRHTAIGPRFASFGRLSPGITPYGIFWTRVEMAVVRFWDGNVYAVVLSFKAIATIASLVIARLIWLVLGRTSPALQLQGTLAYLWNPLIVMEFAGEGHNDAVMIFFSIAAIAACIGFRPTVSLIAQLLGIMTKYVPLLFLPAQLCYLWRVRRNGGQLVLQLAIAGAVGLAIAILLYAPLWAGLQTFDGIMKRTEAISGSATLVQVTSWFLKHSSLQARALPISTVIFAGPMLAWIIWSAVRVKDATDLARTCAWTSLAFVLVASPDYWPWYACMPVAWIIVGDLSRLLWLACLMTVLARLVAPFEVLQLHGYLTHQVTRGITGLGTLVPLIALAVWFYRQRQRGDGARRSTPSADGATSLGPPSSPVARG
jgi:alpha-1,6-mannosyltransferase